MTIPSRPAPPPPQQQHQNFQQHQEHGGGQQQLQRIMIKLPPPPPNLSKLTNKTTSISSQNSWNNVGASFNNGQNKSATNKKMPPPRPPPPAVSPITVGSVLKKPGAPPQSVNVLSSLFGKRKGKFSNPSRNSSMQSAKSTSSSSVLHYTNTVYSNTTQNVGMINQNYNPPTNTTDKQTRNGDSELISFDSPPSSPTLTQKSNSDCVSVDSFSSDSNFSSPQNGCASLPESGFEDDFSSPIDPWETITTAKSDPFKDPFGSSSMGISSTCTAVNQPNVRNMNAINRSQSNDNPLCNGKSLLPPTKTLTKPTIIKPKPILSAASSAYMMYGKGAASTHKAAPLFTSGAKYEKPLSFDDSGLPSLPMPKCPPPPPPPATASLDDINEQLEAFNFDETAADADAPSYGIALYNFEGTEDGDLSFRENEKVYLIKKLNDEWYMGRNKRGCEGIFPSNHIEVKIPLKDNVFLKSTSTNYTELGAYSSEPKPLNSVQTSHKVPALFTFIAEAPEDLTLYENDLVNVLHKINDEWLYGELHGKYGQFPANFLEYIPENLSLKRP